MDLLLQFLKNPFCTLKIELKNSVPDSFYCNEVCHDDACMGNLCESSSHILVKFGES